MNKNERERKKKMKMEYGGCRISACVFNASNWVNNLSKANKKRPPFTQFTYICIYSNKKALNVHSTFAPSFFFDFIIRWIFARAAKRSMNLKCYDWFSKGNRAFESASSTVKENRSNFWLTLVLPFPSSCVSFVCVQINGTLNDKQEINFDGWKRKKKKQKGEYKILTIIFQ